MSTYTNETDKILHVLETRLRGASCRTVLKAATIIHAMMLEGKQGVVLQCLQRAFPNILKPEHFEIRELRPISVSRIIVADFLLCSARAK